jgi:hypothetical protein
MLPHLSTSTPASNVSRADFERNDGSNSAEPGVPSLADILKNSPAAELLGLKSESLPDEDSDVPTPDVSEDNQDDVPEDSDTSVDTDEDDNQETTDEEGTAEGDENSTQNADLPTEEDIDWEYKVPVKIDGKLTHVTLEEIRKGYAIEKHLSQKGRELGELKKQIEEERTTKLQELVQLGTMLHTDLTSAESALGLQYHDFSAQIEKAKAEGDTYTARELKEKREEIQEQYWAVRNGREARTQAVVQQIQVKQAEEQQRLLSTFQEQISQKVPDFNEKIAKSIREFALAEGIPAQLLEIVYDANVVKFINDYRKLKQAKETGSAKRKTAPVAKSVPQKKGQPLASKQVRDNADARSKVLSGNASGAEQLDFLKRISSVSKRF